MYTRYTKYTRYIKYTRYTVVCISLETRSVAKQLSVAVGWVKIKISLMAQLKGLTATVPAPITVALE